MSKNVLSVAVNDTFLFVGTLAGAGTSSSVTFNSETHPPRIVASDRFIENPRVANLNANGDIVTSASSIGGVWKLRLKDINASVLNPGLNIPLSCILNQNYPNPFNPTTMINYQLAVNTRVTLKVYDILGREVKTLVNERQTAGAHSVTFDASTLSSGVYFYRMQAGSYVNTKKLMVIK